MTERSDTGKRGESLACTHLKKKGYRILETNYRTKSGEIDIVARQKDKLVFVEVRSKKSSTFGTPEESLTMKKARHLRASAYRYLFDHPKLSGPWRIDFVAIEINDQGKPTRIEVFENAVGEC